jgi:hypothetical protein
MKINASVLHGLCGRIYKQHGAMDEYRTSKLCSQCHFRLKEVRLRTKDKDSRLVLQENRNVLRCANSTNLEVRQLSEAAMALGVNDNSDATLALCSISL